MNLVLQVHELSSSMNQWTWENTSMYLHLLSIYEFSTPNAWIVWFHKWTNEFKKIHQCTNELCRKFINQTSRYEKKDHVTSHDQFLYYKLISNNLHQCTFLELVLSSFRTRHDLVQFNLSLNFKIFAFASQERIVIQELVESWRKMEKEQVELK